MADLGAVDELRAAHDALVIQARTLEDEVARIGDEAEQLASTFPHKANALKAKRAEVSLYPRL